MASGKKGSRGLNWNHDETLVLAVLKRDAKNEGELGWIEIAQEFSIKFPGQTRSPIQCRRRWETLIKVHNRIQKYCLEKGRAHQMLDKGELSSMKLDTAYRQDWYDVVEHVCSQRKRKEKPQYGSIVVKRGNISKPISTQPSSEDEKLFRLEEENLRLKGQIECLNSEVAQLRQASQPQQISTQPSAEDEKLRRVEEENRRLRGQLECKNSEVEENRWPWGQIECSNSEVAKVGQASQPHQAEPRLKEVDPWLEDLFQPMIIFPDISCMEEEPPNRTVGDGFRLVARGSWLVASSSSSSSSLYTGYIWYTSTGDTARAEVVAEGHNFLKFCARYESFDLNSNAGPTDEDCNCRVGYVR